VYLYVRVFSHDMFLNTVFAQVYFSVESILFRCSAVHMFFTLFTGHEGP
jgi:hypothetical protein